jgi:hypothetical protein
LFSLLTFKEFFPVCNINIPQIRKNRTLRHRAEGEGKGANDMKNRFLKVEKRSAAG